MSPEKASAYPERRNEPIYPTLAKTITTTIRQSETANPFSAPSENSPETTIMGFLNDGELENAYFFAENPKKPIRFTLSNKEPIAYFLTEPVDLGNNIAGFVGISTAPMSKLKKMKKRVFY